MRLIPRRAWAEFIGGPADGNRKVLPLDAENGRPPATQVWYQPDGHPGVPSQTEYVYHLQAAPEGARTAWHYCLQPGEGRDG